MWGDENPLESPPPQFPHYCMVGIHIQFTRHQLLVARWRYWSYVGAKLEKSIKALNEMLHGMAKLFEKEGFFFYIAGPFRASVGLTSPETAEIFLSNKKELLKSSLYDTLKYLVGSGLVTAKGDKRWKMHRKAMNPIFSQKSLERFQFIISQEATILSESVSLLGNGKPLDIYKMLSSYSFNAILEISSGVKYSKNDKKVVELSERFSEIWIERIVKFWLSWDPIFFASSLGKEAIEIKMSLKQHFAKLLDQRRPAVLEKVGSTSSPEFEGCILDMLISHQLSHDASFSNDDVVNEIVTLIMAGFETTATALSWMLFLLGNYPDIQRKIHLELDEVFGADFNRDISSTDFTRMKYLQCALKESLRLYPPIPLVTRKLQKDFQIKGKRISKGTDIAVLISVIHKNPNFYENPEEFVPERFLPENSRHRHPFAFIPYSAGPRNCIGFPLATKLMMTSVCSLMRRFRVESVEKRDKVNVCLGVTSIPSTPIIL